MFPILLFFLFQVEAVTYPFTNAPIDVVIPCHPKDVPILDMCIEGIRKNGENIGKVYVISKDRLTDKAEWVDESIFPFTKLMITERILKEKSISKLLMKIGFAKDGCVYQQLLKFYAPLVLPELSDNILILDADTVFLNPVSFLSPEGNPLLNPCGDMEPIYYNYIKKFLPDVKGAKGGISGISHHMLFQRPVIKDLFSVVEEYHKAPLWKVFCDCLSPSKFPSEYDIYHYFIFTQSDQPQLRELVWYNLADATSIPFYQEKGYHFVSLHSYLRDKGIKRIVGDFSKRV